eukprot:12220537-Alexandrium_andersonii.AAC.1
MQSCVGEAHAAPGAAGLAERTETPVALASLCPWPELIRETIQQMDHVPVPPTSIAAKRGRDRANLQLFDL